MTNPNNNREASVDFQSEVLFLLKNKWLLISLSFIGALAGLLFSSLPVTQYEAKAIVIPRGVIEIEERIIPSDDVQSDPLAYFGLALTDEIMEKLYQSSELESFIGDFENIDELRESLDFVFQKNSSIGEFVGIHPDPNKAAILANTWAEIFVTHFNKIYIQFGKSESFYEIQIERTRSEYADAQASLESFLENNLITEITLDIQENESIIEELQNQNINQQKLVAKPAEIEIRSYTSLYSEYNLIDSVLTDAKTLRNQVINDQKQNTQSSNLSNYLSLLLLKNRYYPGTSSNIQLNINIEQGVPQITPGEVDQFIAVLETRREEIIRDIEAINEESQSRFSDNHIPENSSIENLLNQYTSNLISLQVQLEAEQAKSRELNHDRDLTWQIFQSVSREAEEAKITAQSENAVVQLASKSSVPTMPVSKNRLSKTLISGISGFILATVIIYFPRFWNPAE